MPDPLPGGSLNRAITLGSYGFGALALSAGTTILLQADSRMAAPGWKTAFAIPGLGSTFWGGYLMICGLVMLAAIPFQRRSRAVLAYASIAVSVAIALRTVAAVIALKDPTASGTGPLFFAAIALIYFAHGGIYLGWFRQR